MGFQIFYKDGVEGRFSDESVRLCDPEKCGWIPAVKKPVKIPDKVEEFLKPVEIPEKIKPKRGKK